MCFRCRVGATTCCSACGDTVTGRRCAPALAAASTACGACTDGRERRRSRRRGRGGRWVLDVEDRNRRRAARGARSSWWWATGHCRGPCAPTGGARAGGVRHRRLPDRSGREPRAPGPRQRAELGSALAALVGGRLPDVTLASTPIFVPERRRLDDLVRDGRHCRRRSSASAACVPARSHARALPPPPAAEPLAVAAGSLGSWAAGSGEADEGAAS